MKKVAFAACVLALVLAGALSIRKV